MSVCIRYTKHFEVYERFIGFLNVSEKQDAETIVNAILNFLKLCKLDQVPIVGQSYDGANVMSGRQGGVQTKMKIHYPYATYIHCMAHKLNLIVVDMCKNVKVSSNFELTYYLYNLKIVNL